MRALCSLVLVGVLVGVLVLPGGCSLIHNAAGNYKPSRPDPPSLSECEHKTPGRVDAILAIPFAIEAIVFAAIVSADTHHSFQPALWLGAVITLLDSPERLQRSLRELAQRISRSVTAAQISNIGRAFLQTLRQCLGPQWDDDTESAWVSLYAKVNMNVLAGMVNAARVADLEALAA